MLILPSLQLVSDMFKHIHLVQVSLAVRPKATRCTREKSIGTSRVLQDAARAGNPTGTPWMTCHGACRSQRCGYVEPALVWHRDCHEHGPTCPRLFSEPCMAPATGGVRHAALVLRTTPRKGVEGQRPAIIVLGEPQSRPLGYASSPKDSSVFFSFFGFFFFPADFSSFSSSG
jgi:hypothetical protein